MVAHFENKIHDYYIQYELISRRENQIRLLSHIYNSYRFIRHHQYCAALIDIINSGTPAAQLIKIGIK